VEGSSLIYEYPLHYINGIEHVESKNIQGIALIKLQYPTPATTCRRESRNGWGSKISRRSAFMPRATIRRRDAVRPGRVAGGELVFSSDELQNIQSRFEDGGA